MPMCQTHLRPTPEAVTSALWAPPHQNRHRIRLSFSITQMPPRSVNSVPALLHRLALPFIQAPLLWHRFIPSSQIIAVFSRTALLQTRHHSGAMMTQKRPTWLLNPLWLTAKIFSRHSPHAAPHRTHCHSMKIPCYRVPLVTACSTFCIWYFLSRSLPEDFCFLGSNGYSLSSKYMKKVPHCRVSNLSNCSLL